MYDDGKIELEEYESHFVCPGCGEWCLHHVQTDIYDPDHEDAVKGRHVQVNHPEPFAIEDTAVIVDSDLRGNPSSRRHGITIRFYCETCEAKPYLAIYQHKGTTFVNWVKVVTSDKA